MDRRVSQPRVGEANERAVAQRATGSVRTASGSDLIRKNREIHLGPFTLILFREASLLIRGSFLIRSLPLAVLTHLFTPGNDEQVFESG